MKIVCVLGSPRKNGNTAKVLDWAEDELRRQGHTVAHFFAGDGQIAPCLECNSCKKKADTPGCNRHDQASEIFDAVLSAEAVLLASPVFCWGVSAQMKAFLDRCYCLLKANNRVLIAGKRFSLVLTGAAEVEGNMDLCVPPYKAFVEFFQCKDKGTLLLPYCTTPQAMTGETERQARHLARGLVAE